MTEPLRAAHEVAFTYRRSVGGATRTFLAGLRDRRIWGSVGADGRVAVPPVDWDPQTGAPSSGIVAIGDTATVQSWTWDARDGKAVALLRLTGADTSLLHLVDVADESELRTGMAVRADWRDERTGSITDIRAFVPCDSLAPPEETGQAPPEETSQPPDEAAETTAELTVVSDTRLSYTFAPGLVASRFLRALADGRIEGGRCPSCDGIYVPPRSKCPACMEGPMEPVRLGDRGTVTAFTVVHIPFHGLEIDLPFVCAWIRLDGASVPFAHLLGDVSPEEVSVGQRVRAVWADTREPSWESIRWFRPTNGDVE